MNARRRNLQADLGVRNGWGGRPQPGLPAALAGDRGSARVPPGARQGGPRKDLADEAHGLAAGLLRRGRAPLYHTSLITQKATDTGGLHPDLRDLCGLRWSFGVATTDGAASILGADIREYASLCPTSCRAAGHVGVVHRLAADRRGPVRPDPGARRHRGRCCGASRETASSAGTPQPPHPPGGRPRPVYRCTRRS